MRPPTSRARSRSASRATRSAAASRWCCKGHIAIARAVFPAGTSGAQLDSFARQALWRAGLDFDHGTGHGIGSYLCVHEGPQRIAKTGTVALKPGMIVSNEPGYYRSGAFGIRIENLVVVVEPRPTPAGGERELLGFETLTRAPIDRRLVLPELLDAEERAWLDNYHARVRADLIDLLDGTAAQWLRRGDRTDLISRPQSSRCARARAAASPGSAATTARCAPRP